MSHATPHQQHAQPVLPPAPQMVPAVSESDFELQKRLMRERRELAMKRRLEEEAKEEAERKERIRLKLAALGPAPESNSAKKAAAKDHVTPTQIQPRETLSPQLAAKEPEEAPPAPAAENEAINGVPNQPLPSPDSVEARPQPNASTPAHPWPPAKQAERYPAVSWVAKSVWGAPNNNRSLGNGTFAADLSAHQLANKADPGPIAPPTARAPSDANPRQPPIGPPKQPGGRLSAQERESKQNAWAGSVRHNDEAFRQMLNAEYEERDRRLQKEGRTVDDIQPTIKDTWRPTKLDESGLRNETAAKQTIHLGGDAWAGASETKPAPAQNVPSVDGPRAPGSAPASSILGSAPQPTRGSRFFPAHRERQETTGAQRPKSPSPPPPDMDGHPAFDGDVAHPLVALPPPPVVVRLPPSVPTEPRADSQEPSFAWASQAAYKEEPAAPIPSPSHSAPSHWQEKFHNLLHPGPERAAHPPRSPVIRTHREPGVPRPACAGDDQSWTTKVRDEECFEEQEMGSLPHVRLPNEVPKNAWEPSPPPKQLPKRLLPTVSTADPISFPRDMQGSGTVIRIAFVGFAKDIVSPFGRSRSNPRRGGGGQRGRHPPVGPHARGGKGREMSATYSGESAMASSSSAPPRSRGGGLRGNRDGREGWNRTPIQT